MASVWLGVCLFLYISIITKADECVTYNFENDVDSLFGNNMGFCEGLQLSAFNARRYSEVLIDSPHIDSTSFVSATSNLTCGSTFEFSMTGGGTVEVNVYIEVNYMTDQLITVLAMQTVPDGNDAVVGSVGLSASDSNFENGWHTLRVIVVGTGTYRGYISIMGMGSAESLILVDSFRYIPPSVDEDSCVIYRDAKESTTQPTTESSPETTIEIQDTTTQQIDATEECVSYNFESDFDVRFSTDNYLCNGLLSWQLENYTSVEVESPNPESSVFMSPHEVASCISSFVFKMEPGGIVEASVFMEPVQALDHIIIIAQRVTEKEYDTVAGFIKYHPGNQVFVPGWNVIRFTLLDLTSFDGYLIFIGSADKSSTVLVDSVRYIPPRTPPEDVSCNLY